MKFKIIAVSVFLTVFTVLIFTPVSAYHIKQCDFNGDKTINTTDLSILKTNYLRNVTGFSSGDCNEDGVVNGIDYAMWVNDNGTVIDEPVITGNYFYVSPSGSSSGDGSINRPWDLQTALNQPSSVKPGDTIWLRGGSYRGNYTTDIKGTADEPITVRQYPGERAIVSSTRSYTFHVIGASYVNFWGFEIMSAGTNREETDNERSTEYGVLINKSVDSNSVKFINMMLHDAFGQGMGFWDQCRNCEVYGSLVYNNGSINLDHGIYTQNSSGRKRLENNFIFDNACYGLHAYSESSDKVTHNYDVIGNTLFNNGSIGVNYNTGSRLGTCNNMLFGSLVPVQGIVVRDNYSYYPAGKGIAMRLGYFDKGSTNAVIEGNYFVASRMIFNGPHTNLTLRNNTFYIPNVEGITKSSYSNNQWLTTTSTDQKVFVRTNKYDQNRANVTIYNFPNSSTVRIPADQLSGFPIRSGQRYSLRNVQNYYSDVVSGTYNGSYIEVPMTGHTVGQPQDLSFKPATTFPTFGAFVLEIEGNTAGVETDSIADESNNIFQNVISWFKNLFNKDRADDTLGLASSATSAGVVYKIDPSSLSYTDRFTVNLRADPKGNRFNFHKVAVRFDATKLQLEALPAAHAIYNQALAAPSLATVNQSGLINFDLGIDPARISSAPTSEFTLATLTFRRRDSGITGSQNLSFNDSTVLAVNIDENPVDHFSTTSVVSVQAAPVTTPTPAPTTSATPTPTPVPTQVPGTSSGSILNNGNFNGTSYWSFNTNGSGTFTTSSDSSGTYGMVRVSTASSTIQLFQTGVDLKPNTEYSLSFDARSSRTNVIGTHIIKHTSPYTNYGLSTTFNIGTSWQRVSHTFRTTGFTSAVSDGRFRFWMGPYARSGDVYYLRNVVLKEVAGERTINIYPTEDAFITSDAKDNNYGTSPKLDIDGSPTRISYLKFDLTPFRDAELVKAELKLSVYPESGAQSSSSQNLKLVSTPWSERTITYNNRPVLGSTFDSISGAASNTVKSVDITSTVRSYIGKEFSMAISSSGFDGLVFASKEHSTLKPVLQVTYR